MTDHSLAILHQALDDHKAQMGRDPDRIVIDPELQTSFVFSEPVPGEVYELRISPSFAASLLQ